MRLLELLNQLPRAAKWLVVFAAFIVAYFAVIEPTLNATNVARNRADRLEAALRRERALLATNSETGRMLSTGIRTYGLPRHPTDANVRPETLQRTASSILLDHGVENATYNERPSTIRTEEATAVVGSNNRLERFVVDVTFETSPTEAMAILADLEQARDITAVSRVKIDKALNNRGRADDSSGLRIVRVTITVESWIALRVSASTASASWAPEGGR